MIKNLHDCCLEAKIKVSQNPSGFLPATIELRDKNRSNTFLNFGGPQVLEDPKVIEGALFLKDFTNPIDLVRLN